MDKQEIKNIIENNISNIGNQAPWGAALSKVLNEIVDMTKQGGDGEYSVLEIPRPFSTNSPHLTFGDTFEQIAEGLEITVEKAQNLFTGKYFAVIVTLRSTASNDVSSFVVPVKGWYNIGGTYIADYGTRLLNGIIISVKCTNDINGASVVMNIDNEPDTT